MGLTMSQRRAVTKTIATRYRRASKAGKGVILDELCATTGWHRNHARKALGRALLPAVVPRQPRPRPAVYGPEVVTALGLCWCHGQSSSRQATNPPTRASLMSQREALTNAASNSWVEELSD